MILPSVVFFVDVGYQTSLARPPLSQTSLKDCCFVCLFSLFVVPLVLFFDFGYQTSLARPPH